MAAILKFLLPVTLGSIYNIAFNFLDPENMGYQLEFLEFRSYVPQMLRYACGMWIFSETIIFRVGAHGRNIFSRVSEDPQ